MRPVLIPPGLPGSLGLPAAAKGVVLFAHGSGSGRLSPRNNFVAGELRKVGIGTLLFDLLTEIEGEDRANVFDIELLAGRLLGATDWVSGNADSRDLPIGYFGASTGAAAALVAAAGAGDRIAAMVSRGGRPDLAGAALSKVRALTLPVEGGENIEVRALNCQPQRQLRCKSRLEIVPGAIHLFEEPGSSERVVELARAWFIEHLPRKGESHVVR